MYQRLCVIERRREGERESAGTHLVVDEGREGQEVEQVGEVLPDVGVAVLAQALVVEAVHLGDLARLVVAADERHAVRVPDLEGEEEEERLDRVEAAVDVREGERGSESTSAPSGSDHRRSHMAPSCGTSCFRSMRRICARVRQE